MRAIISSMKAGLLLVMSGLLAIAAPASAAEKVYYFHNDHLGTPQAMTDESGTVVWQAEYRPFGEASVNDDPDGDGKAVVNNLRFPGQYYDAETGLHYNWHRYYEPETGRYLTPDPIGLEGGLNLYSYVLDNPLSYADPSGLDVNVCFYESESINPWGHIGFGVTGESGTQGYYPTGNPFSSPGVVQPDTQKEKQCKTVDSPPDKDKCMQQCRDRRAAKPGQYVLTKNQCTSFVRDCLKECGLPAGSYTGPRPNPFYRSLKGK